MQCRYIIKEAKVHLLKVKNLIRDRGSVFVIRTLIGVVFGYFYYKLFKSSRTFTFQNKVYNYFYHPYNVTWMSERSVEIPIVWDIVQRHKYKKILELGNVLSHYFRVNHEIVDKHEPGSGVANQDIVDFQPHKKYDLMVSISTLEHIGWDETIGYVREPRKITRALWQLKKHLAVNGKMIVTFPVGYNHELDAMVKNGTIPFTKVCCLKRTTADNEWTESSFEDIVNSEYDKPFISANGLVVGFITP